MHPLCAMYWLAFPSLPWPSLTPIANGHGVTDTYEKDVTGDVCASFRNTTSKRLHFLLHIVYHRAGPMVANFRINFPGRTLLCRFGNFRAKVGKSFLYGPFLKPIRRNDKSMLEILLFLARNFPSSGNYWQRGGPGLPFLTPLHTMYQNANSHPHYASLSVLFSGEIEQSYYYLCTT